MEILLSFVITLVNTIFDRTELFFSLFFNGGEWFISDSGVALALAAGFVLSGNITDALLAAVRRWHGGITDQFAAIDNLVNVIQAHQSEWSIPDSLLKQITGNRNALQALINKCRTSSASQVDREQRNALLKSTVGICLLQVKIWAYNEFVSGTLTAEDVHQLGFLLPGETGGHHARKEATDVVAEVKVKVINEDFISVVIDQSAGENAAQVVHGWPLGVHNALVVILASDGVTEVCRHHTTRLHNDIRMPEGSHGKQFIIKAAFLQHVDDEPRFGNEPTFSMPLTTADLAATLDNQHHEEYEERLREVERHRQEIERLLDNAKADKTKA
jgi:hypothetical protein